VDTTELGAPGRAQIDRQFAELLQELRAGQTGVQLLFGFLLAIPFTAKYGLLDATVHHVFTLTVALATLALTFLMSPVLAHRLTFRRKVRPQLIQVSHYCALVGMYLLSGAVLGAVYVVASVAVPGQRAQPWLMVTCASGLVLAWVVLPLLLRNVRRGDGLASEGKDLAPL
jgi:Family of unknown function (DUF6328)